MCLDGGGSTTLTVTEPDSTSAATINKPSDGSERSVSNQIFLVASNSATGVLDHFYVSADNPYVLAGSALKLSASAVDTNYIPMGEDVLGRQLLLPRSELQTPGCQHRRGGCFVQNALCIRELPQPRQQAGFPPAAEGHPAFPQQQEHGSLLPAALFFRGLHRQLGDGSPLPGETERLRRAEGAFRRAVGHADRSPQLHNGLIVHADFRRRLRHVR